MTLKRMPFQAEIATPDTLKDFDVETQHPQTTEKIPWATGLTATSPAKPHKQTQAPWSRQSKGGKPETSLARSPATVLLSGNCRR